LQSPHNGGGQEVNVDPAHAAAMQVAIANERDDVTVRNHGGLMHPLVGGQELPAASSVANEKFSIDQLVPRHFLETEESVQLGRVRRPAGKEPNPHGSVHQDHQATLRLGDGLSRRLGTSRARGAGPRRVRRRSYAAWRTRASSPKRKVAVSVVAPQAAFASLKSSSSTLKVFLHTFNSAIKAWLLRPYPWRWWRRGVSRKRQTSEVRGFLAAADRFADCRSRQRAGQAGLRLNTGVPLFRVAAGFGFGHSHARTGRSQLPCDKAGN